jgi:hypothetical protein
VEHPDRILLSVLRRIAAIVPAAALLMSCSSVGIGMTIPIGIGGVSVGINSDGTVSGGVGIGTGGVSVGVGGTARLPQAPASAASDAAGRP